MEWIGARIETLHKDLLQGREIAQEVNHWVWFKERVSKVKKHLERLKKEFPDLPNEPQISFPGGVAFQMIR